ncbi:hypothetical protein HYT23_00285 [Candidatus Pacearchaeota archaeon]|nr:hypothetical protein [Candidatus Pacearchaeota archaeon]
MNSNRYQVVLNFESLWGDNYYERTLKSNIVNFNNPIRAGERISLSKGLKVVVEEVIHERGYSEVNVNLTWQCGANDVPPYGDNPLVYWDEKPDDQLKKQFDSIVRRYRKALDNL